MAFVRVAATADVAVGQGALLDVKGVTLALFNAGGGRFHATSPLCPHEDGPLAEGWLEGDVVVWACGAWLAGLFAEHVPVRSVLAELFFLDGGPAWADPAIPAFVDLDLAYFGTGGRGRLGGLWRPRLRRFVTSCFH